MSMFKRNKCYKNEQIVYAFLFIYLFCRTKNTNRHGDMLFLYDTEKSDQSSEKEKEKEIALDQVDIELAAKDGWIPQPRDPKYCQHGPHGQCTRCMPIPVSVLLTSLFCFVFALLFMFCVCILLFVFIVYVCDVCVFTHFLFLLALGYFKSRSMEKGRNKMDSIQRIFEKESN